jgi:1-acyl-sn-glycerol-3-phosphate acyltransferase
MTSSNLTFSSKLQIIIGVISNCIATALFTPFFFLLLLLFHPLHLISKLFGIRSKEIVLLIMNYTFLWGLRTLAGLRLETVIPFEIPDNRSVIFVSNHQSMYDITLLLTQFRRGKIRFVAKRELSKWIPSISIALINMEAALIDRKNRKQAITAIRNLGIRSSKIGRDVCIFPEGTRSRTGELLPFKGIGLLTLVAEMKNAIIIPVSISGSWQILQHGFWPVTYGTYVRFEAHHPIDPSELSREAILEKVFASISEPFGSQEFSEN